MVAREVPPQGGSDTGESSIRKHIIGSALGKLWLVEVTPHKVELFLSENGDGQPCSLPMLRSETADGKIWEAVVTSVIHEGHLEKAVAEANRKHRERICQGKDEAIRKGKKPSGPTPDQPRRIVPITRSQNAFAYGECGGVMRIRTPRPRTRFRKAAPKMESR